MTPTIPAELISFSGEARISELDDIDALVRLYKPKIFRYVAFSLSDAMLQSQSLRTASSRPIGPGRSSAAIAVSAHG
jgi:hypothetical protein